MSQAADCGRPPRQEQQEAASPAAEETRTRLELGTLTVLGQIRQASNAVLFGEVEHEGHRVACVYKPVAGERPLWDFPDGTLAQREVAAYEISRATGWDLIPATVLRDGPYGEGMCQAWVGPLPGTAPEDDEEDGGEDGDGARESAGDEAAGAHESAGGEEAAGGRELLAIVEGDEPGEGWKPVGHVDTGSARPALLVHADDERLRRLAVLDAVINNGDRKGGHLLTLATGALYAIDHGVTFNVDDKLRTLLWGWAGEELTSEATATLRGLGAALADGAPLATRLSALITTAEVEALRKRTDGLISSGRHPLPSGDWPAIPWPPV
ncbi:phosphatidylinositol kinase [Streptomyces abyssalis]|uniref:Phosphatidylinositol kinase n=1 Tax=Streptomyces abyssalis TaxID=933944 RepID=A0A1E7JUJ3_9ACTN|nr:SCO1664 family protein [Streptomyces abyssalis]OEU89384.1 phosphatidylinositol kinase [Streptomyces abyssalis]OEU93646.1 phosphatidylinositol kinase [Streptomyces abyssalis]